MIEDKKAPNHQFRCCPFHQTLAHRGLSQGCTNMNGLEGSHPLSFIWPGHHGHHGHPNGHTLAWNIQPFSVARLLLHTQTCQTLDLSSSRTYKKGTEMGLSTWRSFWQWLNFEIECPCNNVWICSHVFFQCHGHCNAILRNVVSYLRYPVLLGPFIVYSFWHLVRLPQSYLWSSVGLYLCLCFNWLHPMGNGHHPKLTLPVTS